MKITLYWKLSITGAGLAITWHTLMAHAHEAEFRNSQLGVKTLAIYAQQCQCIGPIPFHQQKTHQNSNSNDRTIIFKTP
jgi:hypothetical protein